MNVGDLVLLAVSLVIFAYLVLAMLKPEWF